MTNKILLIDIETSPNTAYVWGLWDQNVALSQLIESSRVMCFSYQWYGTEENYFYAEWKHSRAEMVRVMREILDEADIVIHYYGSRFDIPTLNKEIIQHGLTPPSPYRQIDLKTVVSRRFKFPSNKLDYVSQALGLGSKTKHTGFELWVDCMNGVKEAQALMEEYNVNDVALLGPLYERLRPWVPNHPNLAVLQSEEDKPHSCPACSSESLQRRGFYHTNASTYQRYRCNSCGYWSRTRKSEPKQPTLTGAI